MAEENVQAPAPPAAATPLAEAPLSEYVERRDKGERPVPPPTRVGGEDQGDHPPDEPPPLAAGPETPEQAAAAKASRTRGELQRRLDSLQAQLGYQTRQNEKLQRERDEFLARAAQQQPAPEPLPELTPDGPNLEAFLGAGKTYEQWIDARIEYQAQRIADARIAQVRQQAGQAEAQRTFEQALSTFPERAEAAKAKHADYDTVVANNDEVFLSPVMQDVCMRSERGAEIMYWLGKHPDQANQLGELTRAYGPAAYDLTRHHLESLIAEPAARGVPAVAPASAAPAPITPLGGGSTNASSVALDQLPLGDYIRRRNAEAAARRNGGR